MNGSEPLVQAVALAAGLAWASGLRLYPSSFADCWRIWLS